MKLLIIGHSVVDHIFDGENESIAPGGIYYAAAGFNMCSKNEKHYLLTSTSETDSKYFSDQYQHYDLSYADKFEMIPHVNLYVDGNAERREHYKEVIGNLSLSEKIEWKSINGIYVNMITGNDLSGEQFSQLRQNYPGKIYLDVHTLSRGIGKDQHRFFRKIENYKDYLQNVDIVQVNEHELKTITPFDTKADIISEVFRNGVKLLIVTKGEKGVEAYSIKGKEWILDGLKVESRNKVGCGDVFGSVFFYNYIRSDKIEPSLKIANAAAGLVSAIKNVSELKNLNYAIIKRYIED